MTDFTFESKETSSKLETYEWDNTWIELATDETTPRVLYIGDSISCGIRRIATDMSNKTLLFDGFGTSKAIDNPLLMDGIHLHSLEQKHRKYVIFNNGLHGWHIDDEKDYPIYYERMVQFLLEEFKDAKIYIALTTYSKEKTERIIKRNDIATKIAKKYNIPIIDLYSVSKQFSTFKKRDAVHFTSSGYRILAKTIINELNGTKSQ